MLTKESKIRILENFQAIDYVVFGKPLSKMGVCCPFFTEEYLSAKGALMSVMIEIQELIGHNPEVIKEKIDTSVLKTMAKESAEIARENCKILVSSSDGRKDVKKSLRESLLKVKTKKVNIDEIIQNEIKRKAYGLAVDNLLISRPITESESFDKLNTWKGKILEDAYKVLRDNLVEASINVLDNVVEDESKKKS